MGIFFNKKYFLRSRQLLEVQLFVEPHKSFQLFYRTMHNFSHLFGEPEMGPVIKGGGIMILGNQESYFAESLKFHQCGMAPVRFYPAQGLFHLPGRQALFPASRPRPGRGNRIFPIRYLVAERKPSFSPISASSSNFNPQNTPSIPAVKIFAVLDLDEKSWFSLGHYLSRPR